MKRGQGSTEYLVLLAVALIIALVVIGLLGWFPGLTGGAQEQQSRAYWKSATPLSILDYKISGTTVTFDIQNSGSDKVTLRNVSFDGTDLTGVVLTNFNPGERKTITGTVASCTAGAGFTYNVVIEYNTPKITGNKQMGDKPLIGKCV
ncbi:MAG: class III signal peptide-containing protein [Candidatus Micrarchaeota archaeon]